MLTSVSDNGNLKKAKDKLTNMLKTLDEFEGAELEKVRANIHTKAIAQTPYKSGKLEASVYVRISRQKGRPGLVAGARANAPKTGYNYAVIQHENTTFNHPIKGKAHYLSDPFRQEVDNFIKRMKRRLAKK